MPFANANISHQSRGSFGSIQKSSGAQAALRQILKEHVGKHMHDDHERLRGLPNPAAGKQIHPEERKSYKLRPSIGSAPRPVNTSALINHKVMLRERMSTIAFQCGVSWSRGSLDF